MAHPPYQNGDNNLSWHHSSDNTNSSNLYSYPPGLHSQPPLFNGHAQSVAQFQKPPDPEYQPFWQPMESAHTFPVPIPQPANAHLVSQNTQPSPTNSFNQLGSAVAGAPSPSFMTSHLEPSVEISQSAQFQEYIPQPSHTESNNTISASNHGIASMSKENRKSHLPTEKPYNSVLDKSPPAQTDNLNLPTETLRSNAVIALKQLFESGINFNALATGSMLGSGVEDLLRELFISAGLPTHQPTASLQQPPHMSPSPAQPKKDAKPAMEKAVSPNPAPKSQSLSVKKQSTPPITRPKKSREDYLAALAKAKAQSKLNEASKKIAIPPAQIPNQSKPKESIAKTLESPTETTTPKSKLTSKQNEEIRRRLEALKRGHNVSNSKAQSTKPSTGDSTPSTIEYASRLASRTPERPTQMDITTAAVPQMAEPTTPQATNPLSKIAEVTPSRPKSSTKLESPNESKNIPGLFMGPAHTASGTSAATGYRSSPRTFGNPIRPIPRLQPDESLVIELSSDEEDDETESETDEIHTPQASPPKKHQRPDALNRMNSLNSSGTQTPDQAALRLLEIEQQKARMLEIIAKKEQKSKTRPVKTNPHDPSSTSTPFAIQNVIPSAEHANLPNNPAVHPSTPSSLSADARKRDAAKQALIDNLKRELARLESEDQLELEEPNETTAAQDNVPEGVEFNSIESLQAAEHWLHQHIETPSIDAVRNKSTSPVTADNAANLVESFATSGSASSGRIEGELSESEMELDSPIEPIGESEYIPTISQAHLNDQSGHPEGTASEASDDLYAPEDIPHPSNPPLSDAGTSEHATSVALRQVTPEDTPHELSAEDEILLDSTPIHDLVDNSLQNDLSPQNTNQQDHMLTSDDESDIDDYEPDLRIASTSESAADTPQITVADDLAPELQPVPSPQPVRTAVLNLPVKRKAFTPYESPLKLFKAYRYHPEYSSTVSKGFGSVTYCNNIDSNIPLCQWEADGGVCNDSQCQGQHFRDMELADNKIIIDLGIECPSTDENVKAAWHEGLKVFSEQLRAEKVRDPEVIASKLVQFRRAFIGDPSRILNLGDIQI